MNCWRSHARFTRLHTPLPDLDRGKDAARYCQMLLSGQKYGLFTFKLGLDIFTCNYYFQYYTELYR